MVKESVINVRVDEEAKQRIATAAARRGQTVTTFMIQAADKEAARVHSRELELKGKHRGVPSFFRACCQEATRGGGFGYDHPGYHLTGSLYRQSPWDVDDDEWAAEIDKLFARLDERNTDGVWAWFCDHYPKCMVLVPKRRKEQFVAGVQRAYEEGITD